MTAPISNAHNRGLGCNDWFCDSRRWLCSLFSDVAGKFLCERNNLGVDVGLALINCRKYPLCCLHVTLGVIEKLVVLQTILLRLPNERMP